MKIKRFDNTEFRVLQCGKGGGYYPKGTDEGKRALLLMNEGVLQSNPPEKWSYNGYIGFTEYGNKYYDAFMLRVRKKHGHVWETKREASPEFYEDDERGNEIDTFAYSVGYHNGPRCKKCGFEFCHHCTTEFEVEVCEKKKAKE